MDKSILSLIMQVAPSAGKVITSYLSKNKDLSTEDVHLILLSKLVESDTKIIENQTNIIACLDKLSTLEDNHITHEEQLFAKFTSTLAEVCDQLRNTRSELIRSGVIK